MTILAYDAERLRRQFANRRRQWNWRRLLVCASLIYGTVIGVRQLMAYEQLQTQIHRANLHIAQLRLQDAQLKQQIAFARSPQYVREAARSKLGLVPQGEVPFQPLP